MEAKISLKDMKPTKEIDTIGRVCPYPLLMTKMEIMKLKAGEVLKVCTDSLPTVERNVPEFCKKYGYPLEVVKVENKGYWEIYIMKK